MNSINTLICDSFYKFKILFITDCVTSDIDILSRDGKLI